MSKGSKRREGTGYADNYEKIFGTQPRQEAGRFVFDPDTQKVVRSEAQGGGARVHIQGDIEAFKSPINGQIINSRSDLRLHNKEHGVTNIGDYGSNNGEEYFNSRAEERADALRCNSKKAKDDRLRSIIDAVERNSN